MKHIARRDVLRDSGVAALAAAGMAALPFAANASDDPLLGLLNRFMAEQEWLDGYHEDLDERYDELGWDKVEALSVDALDVSPQRNVAESNGQTSCTSRVLDCDSRFAIQANGNRGKHLAGLLR